MSRRAQKYVRDHGGSTTVGTGLNMHPEFDVRCSKRIARG